MWAGTLTIWQFSFPFFLFVLLTQCFLPSLIPNIMHCSSTALLIPWLIGFSSLPFFSFSPCLSLSLLSPSANDNRVVLSTENDQSDYICASIVDVSHSHHNTPSHTMQVPQTYIYYLWLSFTCIPHHPPFSLNPPPYLDHSFPLHLRSIQGYKHCNAFIITQAPMQNTLEDFWRMVWEYKSSIIVMLTQLEEGEEVIKM